MMNLNPVRPDTAIQQDFNAATEQGGKHARPEGEAVT